MHIQSAVTTMLLDGKSVIKPKDFDSYENYEIAVDYIKELSGSGCVNLIYEMVKTSDGQKRSDAILFRITEKGINQLSQQL